MPKIDPDTPLSNGKEIRRLRQELGLSQDELASATGMSRKTVIALEKGAPATHAVIKPLADFFALHFPEVTRKQLIAGREPREPPSPDTGWYIIRIHKKGNYNSFDGTTIESRLRAALNGDPSIENVHVLRMAEGSIIITVQIISFAIRLLLSEYARGSLAQLQIIYIEIPTIAIPGLLGYAIEQSVPPTLEENVQALNNGYKALQFSAPTQDLVVVRRRPVKRRVAVGVS